MNNESPLYYKPIEEPPYIEDENEFGKLLGLLIDGRRIILTATLAFFLIGLYNAVFSTPIYRANALIQVNNEQKGMARYSDLGDFFPMAGSTVEAEKVVVSSRMVMDQVSDELGLQIGVSPSYLPRIGKGIVRMLGKGHTGWLASLFPAYAWGGEVIRVSRLDIQEDLEAGLVLVAGEPGQYKIYADDSLLLTGKVGELASGKGVSLLVTDLVSRPGVEFDLWKQSQLDTVQELQGNLSVSEVGDWSGVMEISYEGENKAEIRNILNSISQHYLIQNVKLMSAEAEKRLAFLQSQLPTVKADLEAAENLLNEYRLRNESVDLSLETKSILEQIVNLDAQLNELAFKEAELSGRFKTTHPNYIALLKKRDTLMEQRDHLTQKVQNLPETQQKILRLTRDVKVNQQIYVQLLNTVQELSIAKAGTVGNVRILDKAEVLGGPVKPKRRRMVIIATLLGFMLGVGIVWLRNALRRGVENPDELEKIGLPVYASVPLSETQQKLDRQRKRKSPDTDENYPLLVVNAANDPAVEAIRSLRTSMHFAMLESEENILMVTGPAQNVGKSFITSNLAAVYAESNKKVLLIDADMRKGYMEELFYREDVRGLSEYLSKQVTRDEAIQPAVLPGLDFISCGTTPPNPSELLMLPEFNELIEWGSKGYDLVIIDSPPILSVTDATLIGRHAGINMLVAKHEITTTKELLATMRRCQQSGVEVKGCILNGVVHRAAGYYGYGHYAYQDYNYSKGRKKKSPKKS